MSLFEAILNDVDTTLDSYVFDSYQSLSSALTAPFWLATTLFVMIYGYLILANKVNPSPHDIISMVMKITIAYILIIEWGLINELLVKTITDTPSYLIGELTGGESLYSSLGSVYEDVVNASGRAYESDGWVMPFVLGTAIFLMGVLVIAYAFFLIVLSKLSLAVLLALTPIFGILYLFKGTSRMMEAWLQQILNFSLLILFTVLSLLFLTELFEKAVGYVPNDPDAITLKSLTAVVLVGLCTFLTLMQIKSLSSAIAGGVALSTFGAYGSAVRSGQGAVSKYGRGIGQKAGAGLSKGFNSAKDRLANPAGRIKSN